MAISFRSWAKSWTLESRGLPLAISGGREAAVRLHRLLADALFQPPNSRLVRHRNPLAFLATVVVIGLLYEPGHILNVLVAIDVRQFEDS